MLSDPQAFQLSRTEIDSAWEYAYRFFFEYPHPFPWHLLHLWEDIDEKPIKDVLSDNGENEYSETLRYLVGEPIDWSV